ncbi:aspartate-alanine antiporter [Achromobacter xylosoxidans]|jgi:aspartate-alanine antiporter|uniref:aspartate-alanine antiporter n=1 Tax=Achromobacter TaxID=222 RepID=UPI0001F41F7B|nr:aspartate-alanine antiporter [Achromobacter xylosoxidans]EFV83462.1 YidE/YbjL duplication [Achromobacter xylosoxidans C54]OFQ49105.1 aspartate-alanine antiporter [Achromobacter xylosoxidans]OMG85783.1 aspartate-alanine antiporter [Achromobacter xylosoxidans]PWV42863.1 aspartate-alanine antiporter [Achromobacter xylosoxidans]QQE57098.1 aspartate-alanine antiporter [Achromobacter xylosoxidans]
MTCSVGFFNNVPIAVLFLTVGLGYLIGKLKIGPIQLGGVCGTLIVALLIGQTGCQMRGDLKEVAFALFIFAMGYSGGPQFFANLNRSSLRYIVLPIIEALLVLTIVLLAVPLFGLDAGTAAGLAAGAATESAVVGTAAEALKHLGLADADVQRMEANIATAYTLTYLVGLISIVFFTSQVAPALLRINLRDASKALEEKLGAGPGEADDSMMPTLPRLVGRSHVVKDADGKTVGEVEAEMGGRTAISRILRNGEALDPTPADVLATGDIVVVLGLRRFALRAGSVIGPEIQLPEAHADDLQLAELQVIVSKKEVNGHTVGELAARPRAQRARGVFLQSIQRSGHMLPVTPATVVQYGDLVTLVGAEPELSQAGAALGNQLRRSGVTDLVFLSFGILAGLLIGSLAARLWGIPVSLGSGGGALVSGLVCGWINAKRPALGHMPEQAVQLLKDLGLAVFVACVGLSAGPEAVSLIREHGAVLPLIGLLVSLGPACLSLWVGHKLLKIEGPLLVGAIAGQHVSTPAISAILGASGSAVPLLGYTVTYAIANVLLPVLGPIIVSLAHHLGG